MPGKEDILLHSLLSDRKVGSAFAVRTDRIHSQEASDRKEGISFVENFPSLQSRTSPFIPIVAKGSQKSFFLQSCRTNETETFSYPIEQGA
jgi:hypothetical protein